MKRVFLITMFVVILVVSLVGCNTVNESVVNQSIERMRQLSSYAFEATGKAYTPSMLIGFTSNGMVEHPKGGYASIMVMGNTIEYLTTTDGNNFKKSILTNNVWIEYENLSDELDYLPLISYSLIDLVECKNTEELQDENIYVVGVDAACYATKLQEYLPDSDMQQIAQSEITVILQVDPSSQRWSALEIRIAFTDNGESSTGFLVTIDFDYTKEINIPNPQ